MGKVESIAFSPDGKLIDSGGMGGLIGSADIWTNTSKPDTTIKLWDTYTGNEVRQFEGITTGIQAVAFSHDGRTIVSADEEKNLIVWDISTGKRLKSFKSKNELTCIAFSPKNSDLAVGTEEKTIQLWDLKTGKIARSFSGHESGVEWVAFSNDGKTLTSGAQDVRLWDVDNGRPIKAIDGVFYSSALAPDGKSIAAARVIGSSISILSTESGKEIRSLFGFGNSVRSVTFSALRGIVASGNVDRTVRFWNLSSGNDLPEPINAGHLVLSVEVSPDSGLIAVASSDKAVRL